MDGKCMGRSPESSGLFFLAPDAPTGSKTCCIGLCHTRSFFLWASGAPSKHNPTPALRKSLRSQPVNQVTVARENRAAGSNPAAASSSTAHKATLGNRSHPCFESAVLSAGQKSTLCRASRDANACLLMANRHPSIAIHRSITWCCLRRPPQTSCSLRRPDFLNVLDRILQQLLIGRDAFLAMPQGSGTAASSSLEGQGWL